MRTGWTVMLAVGTIRLFLAETASGIPMECPPPSTSETVHPVRMTGLVVGAPQTFQYFQRIQEQIVDFVTANSRIKREKFLEYMMATDEIATDVGTVVYGREAVACGLMDRLGSLRDALDCLHRQIARSKKPPEQKRK